MRCSLKIKYSNYQNQMSNTFLLKIHNSGTISPKKNHINESQLLKKHEIW